MKNSLNQNMHVHNSNINQQQNNKLKHDGHLVTQSNNGNIKYRKRCPFTKKEDRKLIQYVQQFGANNKDTWHLIAYYINGRTARQCRERYQLFLMDGIKQKTKWTNEEDNLLLSKYNEIGSHWKNMEQFFIGGTSYAIKNRFISLQKKIKKEQNLFLNNDSLNSSINEDITSNKDKNEDYSNFLYLNEEDDIENYPDQNEYDFYHFDSINF